MLIVFSVLNLGPQDTQSSELVIPIPRHTVPSKEVPKGERGIKKISFS